ncbi:hypothetical protein EHI46_17580 [Rhizobium leguminosarum]|uniref:hypothetical protein n=1 Tax=Rhizobium leguminosarum TaxID=384 RepID=UPI000FED0422|nr:hypothetical protein [Rhizobium leguminosarum]RWY71674.1 hypothetical protein EHI46_17580 [Rhizobium leguminosarum]
MRISRLVHILGSMSEAEKLGIVARVNHRANIEACIEDLIGILDFMDGDENLEPDNDNEPSLGAPEHVTQTHWYMLVGSEQADLEIEDENDEDGGDTELNGDEVDSNFSEDG